MDSSCPPTKFPETGINRLNGLVAEQWPGAVEYMAGTLRNNREQASAATETERIALTDQQRFVMQQLAMPAINDTLSEFVGHKAAMDLAGKSFMRYLADRGFDSASSAPMKAAGFYSADMNLLTLREVPARADSPEGLAYFTKVFVHEYFHFLSHQHALVHRGRLGYHQIGAMTVGRDIRETTAGVNTWDYFKSFNEAINETLTIQTLRKIVNDPTYKGPDGRPVGFYQSYSEYRGLLEQTMVDAVESGATDSTRAELWHMVSQAYLTGQYRPIVRLIRTTYPGISLKEFALMTNVDDLPQAADFNSGVPRDPGDPGRGRQVSAAYRERLRARLNGKTEADYPHDTPMPPPPPPATSKMVLQQAINGYQRQKMAVARIGQRPDGSFVDTRGNPVHSDGHGHVIRRDEDWLLHLLPVLTDAANAFRGGTISLDQAEAAVDEALFAVHHISELSLGFTEFYVLKHRLLDPNLSDDSFAGGLEQAGIKIDRLQRN